MDVGKIVPLSDKPDPDKLYKPEREQRHQIRKTPQLLYFERLARQARREYEAGLQSIRKGDVPEDQRDPDMGRHYTCEWCGTTIYQKYMAYGHPDSIMPPEWSSDDQRHVFFCCKEHEASFIEMYTFHVENTSLPRMPVRTVSVEVELRIEGRRMPSFRIDDLVDDKFRTAVDRALGHLRQVSALVAGRGDDQERVMELLDAVWDELTVFSTAAKTDDHDFDDFDRLGR